MPSNATSRFELDLEKTKDKLKSYKINGNELCPKERLRYQQSTCLLLERERSEFEPLATNAGWQPLYYVNYRFQEGRTYP